MEIRAEDILPFYSKPGDGTERDLGEEFLLYQSVRQEENPLQFLQCGPEDADDWYQRIHTWEIEGRTPESIKCIRELARMGIFRRVPRKNWEWKSFTPEHPEYLRLAFHASLAAVTGTWRTSTHGKISGIRILQKGHVKETDWADTVLEDMEERGWFAHSKKGDPGPVHRWCHPALNKFTTLCVSGSKGHVGPHMKLFPAILDEALDQGLEGHEEMLLLHLGLLIQTHRKRTDPSVNIPLAHHKSRAHLDIRHIRDLLPAVRTVLGANRKDINIDADEEILQIRKGLAEGFEKRVHRLLTRRSKRRQKTAAK